MLLSSMAGNANLQATCSCIPLDGRQVCPPAGAGQRPWLQLISLEPSQPEKESNKV